MILHSASRNRRSLCILSPCFKRFWSCFQPCPALPWPALAFAHIKARNSCFVEYMVGIPVRASTDCKAESGTSCSCGCFVYMPAAPLALLLQKGGCDNGQAVVDAFARMMKQGVIPKDCADCSIRHSCHTACRCLFLLLLLLMFSTLQYIKSSKMNSRHEQVLLSSP